MGFVSHIHKTGFWYPFRVPLKVSKDYPGQFYMGVTFLPRHSITLTTYFKLAASDGLVLSFFVAVNHIQFIHVTSHHHNNVS